MKLTMNDQGNILRLEYQMVRALEGGPIASKADRLAAYQRIGISFEGISAEEVDKADQEAYSITLLKRFA